MFSLPLEFSCGKRSIFAPSVGDGLPTLTMADPKGSDNDDISAVPRKNAWVRSGHRQGTLRKHEP